jgi:beta-1,4-mannosyl-glycoprotein beta-1,4-N-acetylglucosaminyltransferase
MAEVMNNKIYDCFSYWDEDLLLNLRFNLLNKIVDYYVVVESTKTWQNNKKELRFDIEKFHEFKDKIIYVPVKDMPSGDNPYVRENFQRNCILRGLANTKDEDYIIISDADEIPNPDKIKNFLPNMKYAVFKQKHFYYKLNMISSQNPFWYGSRICVKKFLKLPQWLRDLKFKKRPFWRIDKYHLNNIIDEGGWHFCNLKTPEKLLYKYQNLCETNDPYTFKESIDKKYLNLKEIEKRIRSGADIIGRDDKYNKVKLDSTFPSYILENKHLFQDWII